MQCTFSCPGQNVLLFQFADWILIRPLGARAPVPRHNIVAAGCTIQTPSPLNVALIWSTNFLLPTRGRPNSST